MSAWQRALSKAERDLGRTAPSIRRTVRGIEAALGRPELRAAFYAELVGLASGDDFEVFLADWWTQAVAETAGEDQEERERLVELADLARAYESRERGEYVPHDELLAGLAAEDVAA